MKCFLCGKSLSQIKEYVFELPLPGYWGNSFIRIASITLMRPYNEVQLHVYLCLLFDSFSVWMRTLDWLNKCITNPFSVRFFYTEISSVTEMLTSCCCLRWCLQMSVPGHFETLFARYSGISWKTWLEGVWNSVRASSDFSRCGLRYVRSHTRRWLVKPRACIPTVLQLYFLFNLWSLWVLEKCSQN